MGRLKVFREVELMCMGKSRNMRKVGGICM